MRKTIKCKHYNGDGFGYILSDDEELLLCDQCHLNLAEKFLAQLAITVFAPTILEKKMNFREVICNGLRSRKG